MAGDEPLATAAVPLEGAALKATTTGDSRATGALVQVGLTIVAASWNSAACRPPAPPSLSGTLRSAAASPRLMSPAFSVAYIAENELSSLTRQCVSDRRFEDVATLREETEAWSNDVNATQRGVDWQMKIDDARTRLKSVYPTIKL